MKDLRREELVLANGGSISIPAWVKKSAWFLAAGYLIDHWSELKSGIVDGFTDGSKSN